MPRSITIDAKLPLDIHRRLYCGRSTIVVNQWLPVTTKELQIMSGVPELHPGSDCPKQSDYASSLKLEIFLHTAPYSMRIFDSWYHSQNVWP